MGDEKKEEKLLQWHSAFYADLQIELAAEAEYLTFENEHMLGTKPMQLDVLIIKKNETRQIKKNIGRIFLRHNIVEYKSPTDSLSIDDFFKVYGYACFYKSDTRTVNEIKSDDVTITFVCMGYPRDVPVFGTGNGTEHYSGGGRHILHFGRGVSDTIDCAEEVVRRGELLVKEFDE